MSEHDIFLRQVVAGPIETNAYLVGDPAAGEAMLVDPARGAASPLVDVARAEGLEIGWIVNTHGHWDHIADNAHACGLTGAVIAVHAADAGLLRQPRSGSFTFDVPPTDPARLLDEGDAFGIGRLRFRVLHTPGHSPGSICLYEEATGVLFTGDTLFEGSCGRFDQPGGDPAALADSLERLLELPAGVRVYSGHGPETTLVREQRTIPQLVAMLRDTARAVAHA